MYRRPWGFGYRGYYGRGYRPDPGWGWRIYGNGYYAPPPGWYPPAGWVPPRGWYPPEVRLRLHPPLRKHFSLTTLASLAQQGWERPDWWTEEYDQTVLANQQQFDSSQQGGGAAAAAAAAPAPATHQPPIAATRAPAAAAQGSRVISVQIPGDAKPGQNMKVVVDGKQFQFMVPVNTQPGAILQIQIPEAQYDV